MDMHSLITALENKQRKDHVVDVRSGDTVRVHQKITEGSKTRIQIFEGLVIWTRRKNSATSSIAVRRVASGVGVEKTFMLHSPLIEKIEVTKRSKVRRKYLSYMRDRSGKSARLDAVDFDKSAVNAIPEVKKEEAPKEVTTDEKVEDVTEGAPVAEMPAKEKATEKE